MAPAAINMCSNGFAKFSVAERLSFINSLVLWGFNQEFVDEYYRYCVNDTFSEYWYENKLKLPLKVIWSQMGYVNITGIDNVLFA